MHLILDEHLERAEQGLLSRHFVPRAPLPPLALVGLHVLGLDARGDCPAHKNHDAVVEGGCPRPPPVKVIELETAIREPV